jgi:hypothetical protein
LKGLSYAPTGGIVAAVTTRCRKDRWHPQLGLSLALAQGRHLHLLAFLNAGYTEATVWQHWLPG